MLSTEPWSTAPCECDRHYFRTWQRVSLALQDAMRRWIPEIYFRDESRFEDRDEAYQVVAYSASQPSHGQARTEFTYDMADPQTPALALRNTGRRMQAALAPIEQRLRASGRLPLSRRYAPVWYLDILNVVKSRRRKLIALLACESKVINAVIDLGSVRDLAAVRRFERTTNNALRSIGGVDFRELIPRLLEESSRVLQQQPNRADNIVNRRTRQRRRARAAGSPDLVVGSEKNSDDRRSDGGGQMADAGIVPDVNPSRREPAGQGI